ncbi:MAG: hypothetical protein EOP34_06575 [Rickettsiales bacterium]|nr:MAG: hypothetical protein EOP34_06575 [Rickettsiales bacterium]
MINIGLQRHNIEMQSDNIVEDEVAAIEKLLEAGKIGKKTSEQIKEMINHKNKLSQRMRGEEKEYIGENALTLLYGFMNVRGSEDDSYLSSVFSKMLDRAGDVNSISVGEEDKEAFREMNLLDLALRDRNVNIANILRSRGAKLL